MLCENTVWDFWRWWQAAVGWESAVVGGCAASLACAHIHQERWPFGRPPPSTHGSASARGVSGAAPKSDSCNSYKCWVLETQE